MTPWATIVAFSLAFTLGILVLWFFARLAFLAWVRAVYADLLRDIARLEARLSELRRLDAIVATPLGRRTTH